MTNVQPSARDHNSDDDDDDDDDKTIRTAAAVLRAALVASCLRGALPRNDKSKFTFMEVAWLKVAHLQSTCGRFARR
jgi:hypothetical protein